MRIKYLIISFLILTIKLLPQNCTSSLIINSNKNLLVEVDTNKIISKYALINLSKGNYKIKVQEYKIWNSLFIDSIKIENCNETIDKNYIFQYKNNFIKYDLSSTNNNHKFYEGNLFKILIGSSIVLGAISAYFKINADKKYDDYLITKDQSTLKKVNQYDLISGISLGLLQINFGYLIYKFLSD